MIDTKRRDSHRRQDGMTEASRKEKRKEERRKIIDESMARHTARHGADLSLLCYWFWPRLSMCDIWVLQQADGEMASRQRGSRYSSSYLRSNQAPKIQGKKSMPNAMTRVWEIERGLDVSQNPISRGRLRRGFCHPRRTFDDLPKVPCVVLARCYVGRQACT